MKFQGWLVERAFFFAFLIELVFVNRVSQTGRGNRVPVKTSHLRRDRKEVVRLFGATYFGSRWSFSPFPVAKEFNQYFGIKLRKTLRASRNPPSIPWWGHPIVPKASQACYSYQLRNLKPFLMSGFYVMFNFFKVFCGCFLLGFTTTQLWWAGQEGLFPFCRRENSS